MTAALMDAEVVVHLEHNSVHDRGEGAADPKRSLWQNELEALKP
jgi:hypothetical protein